MSSLVDLKEKGYRIALDDFCIQDKRWDDFVNTLDIIKFDIQKTPLSDIKNQVQRLKSLKLLTLAEKVENYTEYQETRAIEFDYFRDTSSRNLRCLDKINLMKHLGLTLSYSKKSVSRCVSRIKSLSLG